VHVEVEPGVVTVLPDWMLDASTCIGVAIDGNERVMLLLNFLQRDQTLGFPVGCVSKLEGISRAG
jgi:hypothetical protein